MYGLTENNARSKDTELAFIHKSIIYIEIQVYKEYKIGYLNAHNDIKNSSCIKDSSC